jgi:hypothetical protein
VRKLVALAAFGLVALFASCDTLNVGNTGFPTFAPIISAFTVTAAAPNTILEGLGNATAQVTWAGGTGPYTVSFNFGGAATNPAAVANATSPTSTGLTFVDVPAAAGQDFTATVTVTDSRGFSDTETITVHVAVTPNVPPTIDSIVVAGAQATVNVSDADGDALTITLDSTTGGLSGSPASAPGPAGVFSFSVADIFAGGSGTATFTVSDGIASDTDTSGTITIAPLVLPNDALGAVPLVSSAGVGDTVKVIVATGPVADLFQFMTGVSVVFPAGCDYDANSYDYGAPVPGDSPLNPTEDKDQETIDGIWTTVNPTSGFLGVGDNLLAPDTALPAPFDSGFSARDFNITPLGGSDAPVGTAGVLFNFNLGFSAPGAYSLKFLDFDEVQRTYYQSNGTPGNLLWNDLSNSVGPVTVTVN